MSTVLPMGPNFFHQDDDGNIQLTEMALRFADQSGVSISLVVSPAWAARPLLRPTLQQGIVMHMGPDRRDENEPVQQEAEE